MDIPGAESKRKGKLGGMGEGKATGGRLEMAFGKLHSDVCKESFLGKQVLGPQSRRLERERLKSHHKRDSVMEQANGRGRKGWMGWPWNAGGRREMARELEVKAREARTLAAA
jgi:hypothetical protein